MSNLSNASTDLLSDSMTRLATNANKQRKLVIAIAVIALASILALSLYLTKRNAFRAQASEALFNARSALQTEMQAFSESLKPATPAKKDAKAKAPTETEAPSLAFLSFDVSGKLPQGTAALEKVAHDFPGTTAGFDAMMDLGSLYFDHSTGADAYEKAASWFEKAASTAPSKSQTIAALYNLGYAQEALGRCGDAIKSFDRALNSNAGPLLGEIYRAKARCQETLGDTAGAKATYEKITKTLPNTEAAAFAETKKATL